MLRNRCFEKKEIVTVVECINTIGSGTFAVPIETDSIDYCVIAGGGGSCSVVLNGGYNSKSGAGGYGGRVINVLAFSTLTTKSISYTVGDLSQSSVFGGSEAKANYTAGATAVGSTDNYPTTTTNGNDGTNGEYLFSNEYNTGYFGVSGGSGGFIRCNTYGELSASGGYPNGGRAYIKDADISTIIAASGSDGSNYGNGGGGAAFLFGPDYNYYGSNSKGKQGAIFIRYNRYKIATDNVVTVNGHKIVKINW